MKIFVQDLTKDPSACGDPFLTLAVKKKLLHLLSHPDVLYLFGSADETGRRESAVNGVLNLTIGSDPEGCAVSANLKSVDGRLLSRFHRRVRMMKQPERSGRTDFQDGVNRFAFLEESAVVRPQMAPLKRSAALDFWENAIYGRVTFRSSSPASLFLLSAAGRIPLGRLPVEGYRLREGAYRFEIRRENFPNVYRDVNLPAGKQLHLMIRWPDEPQRASIAMESEPAGLRFFLDGRPSGIMPVHAGEIEPGIHTVKLIGRSFPGRLSYTSRVAVTTDSENRFFFPLRYGEDFSRDIMASPYWHKIASGDLPFSVVSNGGLGFVARSSSLSSDAVIGIRSDPFPLSPFQFEFGCSPVKDLLIAMENEHGAFAVRFREEGLVAGIVSPGETNRQGSLYRFAATGQKVNLRFDFSPRKGEISLRIDGGLIGVWKWTPERPIRIVIGVGNGAQDGRIVISHLKGKIS